MTGFEQYLNQHPEWPHVEAMRLDLIVQLVMKQTIRQEIPVETVNG